MDKKNIEIKATKPIKIDFQDQEILISPYMLFDTKNTLMKDYIESFFSGNNTAKKYLESEYVLALGIIDLQTNINIEGLSLNDVIDSGLWEIVKSNIANYKDFKLEINEVVKLIREDVSIEKSIGNKFDKLSDGITNFLNKISEVDLSKEGISKLLDAIEEQKNEYNKIVDPSKVVEKPKTRKKKEILQ